MKVHMQTRINPDRHRITGAMKLIIDGIEFKRLPALLQIDSFDGDSGFYLLRIDINGNELTDTYHESIEAVLEQAKLEYEVELADWISFREGLSDA